MDDLDIIALSYIPGSRAVPLTKVMSIDHKWDAYLQVSTSTETE